MEQTDLNKLGRSAHFIQDAVGKSDLTVSTSRLTDMHFVTLQISRGFVGNSYFSVELKL